MSAAAASVSAVTPLTTGALPLRGAAGRQEPTRPVDEARTISYIKLELARPERFELPTLGFEDRYSIQLSYGRRLRASHSTKRGAGESARDMRSIVKGRRLSSRRMH